MSQRALISVLVLFCLNIEFLFAQPTLDPAQTVNPSTGQMSFALPLGTVHGANGADFPIVLSYRAGVKQNQEASPVGLGFGYEAGIIVKKTVFVADDNHGGNGNFFMSRANDDLADCDAPTWYKIINFFWTMWSSADPGAGFIQSVVNLAYGPGSYHAISGHEPLYSDPAKSGMGFFRNGASAEYDLPDIYFVACPYINGSFSYKGKYNTGHFVFSQTGGSGSKDNETVKITRAEDAAGFSTFIITLANGMRLFFEKHDDISMNVSNWAAKNQNGWDCCYKNEVRNIEAVPQMWRITKVLYPDYVDSSGDPNDPMDSRTTNKGNWINFGYSLVEGNFRKPWTLSEVGVDNRTSYVCAGFYGNTRLNFLSSITTDNESAVYNYTFDSRLDDLWFFVVNDLSVPKKMPVLDSITIKRKDGKTYRRIEFKTAYDQRPNSFSTFLFSKAYIDDNTVHSGALPISRSTGNSEGRSLTLKSLKIYDRLVNKSFPVTFEYDATMNYPVYSVGGDNTIAHYTFDMDEDCNNIVNTNYSKHWYIDQKDLWGYFRENTGSANDYNRLGVSAKALNADGKPWAAAWSVTKVTLPGGSSIAWDYEANRFDRTNGIDLGTTRYGGGIRVKKVTATDGLVGTASKPFTLSYFYTSSNGVFDETTGGCSGYATAEPYNTDPNTDPNGDYRQNDLTKGGLYSPAMVAYEKTQVVQNYQTSTPNAPVGYTIYDFTHAGNPSVMGYHPNPGPYGDFDCSWQRGLPVKTAHYNQNGKMVDSTFNGYTFTSQDTFDYSYPDIETQTIKIRDHNKNGGFNYGWTRLDSTIAILMGVRKKETFKYCDNHPNSRDYARLIVPKTCMKYSSSSPTLPTAELTPFTISSYTRTTMVKGAGAYPNTAVIYIARGLISGPDDEHVHLQAISNVDITAGSLNLDNAQWSNVKPIFNRRERDSWILTGMDAIAYDDDVKNDLLLQFVNESFYNVNGVKFILLQNVRVEGDNIRYDNDAEIPLRVHDETNGFSPTFQCSSLRNFMEKVTCSAVCNLEGDPLPDIVFYNSDHGAAYHFYSFDPSDLYVMEDIDFHVRNPWTDETGATVNSVSYDYSKSVKAKVIIQDPNGHYPEIGSHALFLDLDNDGKQNDWVATDMCKNQLLDQIWSTTINDIVIKNITVNPTTKTITFPPLDPTLRQTTHIVNPAPGNFDQGSLFSSVTNTFGLVTAGDLSQKMYPFHFPAEGNTLRTLLYGTSKVQADADLDGLPNEVWSTAPQNKCLVTKTVPAYLKYPELGIPSVGHLNNKHMLTSTCQKIVYAGPEVTGSLLREYWLSISGSSVDDFRSMLYSRPDATDELAAGGFFDCPTNFADNYGERIRGYITPPTTGSYTFWIASDDNSELWLSLDENPGNKKKIASITGSIWTNHNVWNAYPSQQSCPINLTGGKRYYVEVLHKEGTGGDNLSVGWQGPGITGDAERPIPLSRFTPLPTPKNVVSSQATTWSNSSGAWKPISNYSWKTEMNSSGLPTSPLIDFNFATPSASNAAWKFTGSIEKYDNFSAPLEAKNSKGIYSTTIYRNDVHLPIAAVANSKYDECAVYTCDHDINNDNGWEKGSGCSMSATRKHFGDSSVYVDKNYGPTKNITGCSTAKSYVFSAWVYPLDGNRISLNVEKRIGGVYSDNFGKDFTFTAAEQNKWNLVKVPITPAQLTGMNPGSDYLRIHVSCNPGNNAQFYVDDIRFYPKNAIVMTTYYDSKWYQPILSVDANNNPSQKVEYDDFGRPVRWYKFDKTTTNLTLLQEKEYHLMGDYSNPNPTQWYKIVPDVDENYCIDIEGSTYTDGQNIQLLTYAGTNSQLWKFTPAGDGYYNIVSKGGPTFGITYDAIADRTQLKIRPVSTADSRKWKLSDAGEGFCRISAKASDAAFIDLEDGNAADGSKLQIYQSGTYNRWKLVLVE